MSRFLRQALVFLAIVLMAACQREPAVAPKLKHLVGEALEGTYRVCYGPPDRIYDIGDLKLKDGLYSFTPLIPVEQIPQSATERLSFVRNPEGRYSIKYKDPVNEDILLEDLNGLTFLALIGFSAQSGTTETTQGWDGIYIESNQESKSLSFQSFYNELQMWCAGKSWD